MQMPDRTKREALRDNLTRRGFVRVMVAVPNVVIGDEQSRAVTMGPLADLLRALKLVSRHATGSPNPQWGSGRFEEWIPSWVATICQYAYMRLNPTEMATIARKLKPVLKACCVGTDVKYAVIAAVTAGATWAFIEEMVQCP